jgi:hypothetical protein
MARCSAPAAVARRREDGEVMEEVVDTFIVCSNEPNTKCVGRFLVPVSVPKQLSKEAISLQWVALRQNGDGRRTCDSL